MATSRRALALSLLLVPAVSLATPQYLETFLKTYQASGRLKEAGCAICHTQVPRHNAYGTALNAAMTKKNAFDVDAALLRAIEGLDSDGDGVANGDEIRADTLPGNASSRPVSSPAAVVPATPSPARAGLVPKHAFHPLLVHFPLALFIFGGALDLLGLAKNRSDVRKAGIWNMTAAAIATALAIPTGFLAAFWSGYPLEVGSAVFTHLLFAIGATVLMTALVALRSRREPKGIGYVLLLAVTIGLIGWAGHLGGDLVYGG